MPKRKCKNVDIANFDFIKKCICDCMRNKPARAWNRTDVKAYWKLHNGDIDSIAKEMQNELKTKTVHFPTPRISVRIDRSNGKERTITVEDIKEQYYDYVAFYGLDDLAPMIGEYQIACVKGKGPILGARIIKGWLKDDSIRYAIKADVKQCYPSIKRENMMRFIRRHVKNDTLVYLIETLLVNTPNDGLPIGSYLSIRLCALYLSQLYQHIGGSYFRRNKNIVSHVMFFLDDIYIFGTNARAMHKAMRGIVQYSESIGLRLKPDWKMINLNPGDKHAHFDAMGYRIYRDRITMRRRDYVKTRAAFRRFQKRPCYKTASSVAAYHGLFVKVTDSYRFRKKYGVKRSFRKARKIISDHDKGDIFRTAAAIKNVQSGGEHDSVPDLCT